MGSSDSEDEENVIRYGTPLEPFEEDEVPSKRSKQPVDQFAVDTHGQRRFHGAFTGGFSAGWGNSVGTPEGWTPSTFKSSRGEKAQVSSQRPEDFMDDEDRGEFGIAPRFMQTHSEFTGQKRTRQQQYHDGPIPGEPVLEQLLRPVHETTAVRILSRMGWRVGQGAGARLRLTERRAAVKRRQVYGCYVPPEFRSAQQTQDSEEDSSDSEYDYDTLFAPEDYEPYVLARKNDRFGLGYSGLSRRSVLGSMAAEYGSEAGSTSHLVMREKGKKVSIRGQAFGVGALEADDEDIYATEDMSHYDFSLGGPAEEKQKKKNVQKAVNVLEGFVKATKPLPSVPSHPAPALPRDYAPAAAGARRSRFEPSDAPQRDQGLGRHELSAAARGSLLGEEPLPPIQTPTLPKPAEPSDPIAKLLGRNVNFVSNTETQQPKELDFIPIKDSGKEINPVFKPFASDPQKQARYEKYCKDKDSYVREEDGDMERVSAWERGRELSEFEQAAKLYQPLTGVMGDRFTHASQPDDAVNPLTAVARSSASLATTEQVEAAARGVYGLMTRCRQPWRPLGIVCKRFNVPEPGGPGAEPEKTEKPKVSYSIFSYLESSVHDKESFAKEQSKFSGSKSVHSDVTRTTQNKPAEVVEKKSDSNASKDTPAASTSEEAAGFKKRMTVAELFLKESEKDLKSKDEGADVTETINKFDKMEIYKSIFLSDSEDEEEQPKETEIKINFDDYMPEIPKNTERNTSPPRGIFANVDFDEINSWRRNAGSKNAEDKRDDKPTTSNLNNQKTIENNQNDSVDNDKEDTYGPKIPENLQKRLQDTVPVTDNFRPVFRSRKEADIHVVDSSSSSDSWVDINEVKKIKKLKKKKSKKHKSKHKKSKHKKRDI